MPTAREDEGPSPSTGPAARDADDLNLEQLARVWPAVLDQILQTAPALAATFEGARPVGLDEEGLTIGFPPNATFNKRKAEAPDKRDQLVDAIEAVIGEKLRPVYVLLDGEDEGTPSESPAPAAAAAEDDHDALVEKLKSEFNAEEVG